MQWINARLPPIDNSPRDGNFTLLIYQLLFSMTGLLLLFCAYLAWETRKVHIAALNDSKLIGLSVYNVIIPCVLVIPILGLVRDRPTAKFALTSFLTIFCTTFTLCFVFVPKVMHLVEFVS